MHTKTLAELSRGLKNKEYSSVELTQHFLGRIKQHNQALNAFITITEEQALAQAQQSDELLAQGTDAILAGVPIAHKDIFCTEGVRTTCGSKMLHNFISPYDATVVTNMRDNGVVMLGKTNMDEFAMGSSNETSYFGAVKNPWDTNKVPGGSSGGSASAVAARLAPAATATDTGGSIRQPAALCNLTGIKPTYGAVSRYGMIAFASSLDQAGTLTYTAEDSALLLQAMAGFDEKDSTSIERATDDYVSGLNNDIKGLKIGIPDMFFDENLTDEIAVPVKAAIAEYEKMGMQIVEIKMPNLKLSVPTYYVVAPAECSSNLSRFDGVRFGHRCEDPQDLVDLYKRSRGEGFGDEVKRRIMTGTYVLSAGYYDAYYLQAQKARQLIKADFDKAFAEVDVIMGPTAPNLAFGIGELLDDPIAMYLNDLYTIGVNLAGLPGMSIPCGFAKDAGGVELPVGLQLIGNYFDEARLLNVAHKYQQVTDWHSKAPVAFL